MFAALGANMNTGLAQARSESAGEGGQSLVVVELFTSQGCNSCPPADEVLAKLSMRKDVLALSYSVDYWNYLGWKDTLAQPDCTIRQRKYNISLGKNGVYTPQMIIQGARDVIGSKGDLVKQIITDTVPVRLSDLDITFDQSGDMINLRIGASDGEPAATIWVIGYDFERTVDIRGGENAGQTRTYHNVVQSIKRIGSWMGQEVRLTLSRQDLGTGNYDAYALLLQSRETGPIIAAVKLK
ncbi:hypothetical protein that often co-occurs with aconitase [hydrothermal vent metagenome]|uniref:DUF1223 domain-containing protein n=1 Tax=hydrothermal vent metagenome TaxID=652676 RepID=A0A3B0RFI0_9ZZZZ